MQCNQVLRVKAVFIRNYNASCSLFESSDLFTAKAEEAVNMKTFE